MLGWFDRHEACEASRAGELLARTINAGLRILRRPECPTLKFEVTDPAYRTVQTEKLS